MSTVEQRGFVLRGLRLHYRDWAGPRSGGHGAARRYDAVLRDPRVRCPRPGVPLEPPRGFVEALNTFL